MLYKQWMIVVIAAGAGLAVLALMFGWPRTMKIEKDDIEGSRAEVLRLIPIGSDRAHAERVLKEEGFTCGLVEGLVRNGELARGLNCDRSTWTGIGSWRIGVWLDGERVEDISISYGNTAF